MRVTCGGCDATLSVPAWPDRSDAAPEPLPLGWRTRVPTEVTSRRGRVRKTRLADGWVDIGARVPLQRHGAAWEPDFSACACPGCGGVGRLATFDQALRRCPRCAAGPMTPGDDD